MSTTQQTSQSGRTNAGHRDHRDVTEILAQTMARFPQWRERCAFMSAMAERPAMDRTRIARDCEAIRSEVLAARTDIIFALADAPQRLAGHSRVVDVERALDSVDAAISQVERRLN